MSSKLENFDHKTIKYLRRRGDTIGRIALFIIFFWFGILKVFLLSPAGPLVVTLLNHTFLGFIDPESFLIGFGLFEVILGIMILIPKLERITFALLALHLFTTILPLFLLPGETWSTKFVPTLVGQYIIKNAALLALGLVIFSNLKPMTKTHSIWGEKE